MSEIIFENGQGIIVSARGPGSIHLLTSNPVLSNAAPVVGTITTTPSTSDEITRFMISFSHNFQKLSFYWDGAGEAVYGKGQDLLRQPVGNGWNVATTVNWHDATVTYRGFTTEDVTTVAASSSTTIRNNLTTCFIIPDNLL